MTSVLNVDTIADKAGTGPVGLTKQSAAKAFAKVTQDSTHTLNSDFNISSIVDGGPGETDLPFTSNMNDANYAVSIGMYVSNNRRAIAETVSTSQITVQTFQVSSNSSAADATNGVACTIMGDLA